jgi:hypothetical protein
MTMTKTANVDAYKARVVDAPLAELAAQRAEAMRRMNAKPAGTKRTFAGTEAQPPLKRPIITRG